MKQILSMLRCIWAAASKTPHEGKLRTLGEPERPLLVCGECGAAYLVMANGIPVMLGENELSPAELAELNDRRTLYSVPPTKVK